MAMPWTSSDVQGKCSKHPDRRPSPGVCSVCLKERLTHLSSCKPSSSSSPSFSLSPSPHQSRYSSPSASSSYSLAFSSPSTPSLPPPSSCGAVIEEGTRISYLISKEGRFTERAGRLWPLRRSSSSAFEVKRSIMEKKQKKAAGRGNGLWSLLRGRKEVSGEKAKNRSCRFPPPKVVKDVISLGVR